MIVLAGVPLDRRAARPRCEPARRCSCSVQEVTAERVTLQLDPQAAQARRRPSRPPPHRRRRGPRRSPSRSRRGARAGGEEAVRRASRSAFDSSVLGRLDLRLELARGSVQATVEAPAGRSFELASEAAARLQDALAREDGPPGRRAGDRAPRSRFDAYA